MAPSRRRGSNTVEFALILPIFLALVGTLMEYSFYFFMRSAVARSVRDGCRAGAVIPPDDTPSPEDTAENEMKEGMGGYNFFGADCDDADDSSCSVGSETSGSSPTEMLTCTMTMNYRGITGVVPVPEVITYSALNILEVQR